VNYSSVSRFRGQTSVLFGNEPAFEPTRFTQSRSFGRVSHVTCLAYT
jgi:hypothetical protein